MSLEQKICEEIKAWSKYALEIPNENYNNLINSTIIYNVKTEFYLKLSEFLYF